MPLDPFHRFPIPEVVLKHGKNVARYAVGSPKNSSLPWRKPDGDVL